MKKKILFFFTVLFLLGIHLILNAYKVRDMSFTYDETGHYYYAARIINGKSVKTIGTDGTKMPVSCLNHIPCGLAHILKPFGLPKAAFYFLNSINSGRYITMFFSLATALYVFFWANALYGATAGIFSLLLYTLSPNIIAHSRLITNDIYAAGIMAIATYYFWRLTKFGGKRNLWLSAISFGLAQIAKYTCVFLIPVFSIILILRYGGKAILRHLSKWITACLLFFIVTLLIINAGYFFQKTFVPLGKYEFLSAALNSAQAHAGIFKALPIPVPYAYLQGLDWVQYFMEGRCFNIFYLLGNMTDGRSGFPGYFFYAYFFKEPIALQVILFLALYAYIRNRRKFNFLEDEIFLFIPVIFFSIYLNFFFQIHIGIRYFLVVIPFVYVFCGSLIKSFQPMARKTKIFLSALVIYLAVSALSYAPYYLSYFNELVWDRKMSYKILGDSNIDFGQGDIYLDRYLKTHPDVILEPDKPRAGTIIVGVNKLLGIRETPEKFRWLRDNFKPVGHMAYCFLIYKITPGDLQKIPPPPEAVTRVIEKQGPLKSAPKTSAEK